MNNKVNKFKSWVLGSFQFITLGMLIFCIFLLVYQQTEIKNLQSDIRSIKRNCDTYQIESKIDDIEGKLDYMESNLSSEIDDIEGKLDYMESNLSSEIDDVRSAVIIWSD